MDDEPASQSEETGPLQLVLLVEDFEGFDHEVLSDLIYVSVKLVTFDSHENTYACVNTYHHAVGGGL